MLDLLDYRRRVTETYQFVRESGTSSPQAHARFCAVRDELFQTHPQSPLDADQKKTFGGLNYYEYDPAYRIVARVEPALEEDTYTLELGADGRCTLRQFGLISFRLPTGAGTLGLCWIEGYGGGLFLPFRDATNGDETYGGGRYLYDTIKGADLGSSEDRLVLDFNYAYHPSCYYNARWVCPLAPPSNRLEIAVPVGEKL